MVAPIDAKAQIEVDGETITLRLNFRSISLCELLGVDLFDEKGIDLTLSKSALLLQGLSVTDHAGMTEDEALAVVVHTGIADFGKVVLDLIARFGGKKDDDADKADAEGNVPPAATKTTTRKKTAAA